MAKNKTKNWFITEITFLLLAPLFALLGVVVYGILFDHMIKDPKTILQFSVIAYLGILAVRLLRWLSRVFGE